MTTRLRLLFLAVSLGWPVIGAAGATLIWHDEFDLPPGSAPDAARWSCDLGAGGWGNNELESYTDTRENSFITADAGALDGRALAIRAIRTPTGGHTSARLKTQRKFSFTYGRVEARMKLTRGRGLWPAFWLLGESIATVGWPACGEIDIMEQLGHDPGRIHGTLHGPGYSGGNGVGFSTVLPGRAALSDDYHVFAIDWSPARIDWSLDGVVYASCSAAQLPAGTRWVFDAPAFLILNLAVGGHWPGNPDATTVFPQTLLIDYVRVYGVPPGAPASLGVHAPVRDPASLALLSSSEKAPNPDCNLIGYTTSENSAVFRARLNNVKLASRRSRRSLPRAMRSRVTAANARPIPRSRKTSSRAIPLPQPLWPTLPGLPPHPQTIVDAPDPRGQAETCNNSPPT